MPEEVQDNDPAATVTRLLHQARAGDRRASEELLPLVYQELRALAARKMRQERPDQTLQPTALVHEAYLRLVDQTAAPRWDSRFHFFTAAAEAMRRILVDQARHRGSVKCGGDRRRIELDEHLADPQPAEDLLALDEALDEFAQKHPQEAQLVKFRYFAGMTMDEAAEAMGISARTAARAWAYARAWLYTRIEGS